MEGAESPRFDNECLEGLAEDVKEMMGETDI